MRWTNALTATLLLAISTTLFLVLPANAYSGGPETVRVVIHTDTMRDSVEHAVSIWNRDQDEYQLQTANRCRSKQKCIIVGDSWDAGDWYQLDGIDYGASSWQESRYRYRVELPLVLTHEPLLARFSDHLDATGESRLGVPVGTFVQAGVAAHEIGHCLGYEDKPGAGFMSSFPDDRL